MKKIILLPTIIMTISLHAEIKDLDLIFLDGVQQGVTGVLKNANALLSGDKNISKRMKVYRKAKNEKLIKHYKNESKRWEKNYWDIRHKLEAENRKYRIENEKLKKLLKLHDIDYNHAEIRVDTEKKPKKMEMTITDK